MKKRIYRIVDESGHQPAETTEDLGEAKRMRDAMDRVPKSGRCVIGVYALVGEIGPHETTSTKGGHARQPR